MAKFTILEDVTRRGVSTIYSFDNGRCVVKTVTKHVTQWRVDAKPTPAATAKRILDQLVKGD